MTRDIHESPYTKILSVSERKSWTVAEVLGTVPRLDLSRPFLPESMTRVSELSFLSPTEQLAASQLRGYTYARISAVIEEGILPFVLGQLRGRTNAAMDEIRMLLRFADEEVKHIQLFGRYAESYETATGVKPDIIPTREKSIASAQRNHPLSVALLSAHVEWMTQSHYLGAVKNDEALDETTVRVLTYHYVEEVQHARVDELLIDAIARTCSPDEIAEAIEGYRFTCRLIQSMLLAQVDRDANAFQALTGRTLTTTERDAFVAHQHASNVETILGAGANHPRVQRAIERLSTTANAA